MQNAWRFVDDEVLRERLKEAKGIGTPATRAEIIGGLKKQGFLIAQGKHIVPTEAGLSLFGVLKQADPALVDPGVTAQLECLLDDVVVGKQEMVGAIDAVCNVAERIIGKLKEGAAAGGPPLLGAAVGNGPGTYPPTPAMKRFADSLARQKGIKPPPGYKTSISICRKFLNEHAPKKADGEATGKLEPKPVSPAQLLYAKKIAQGKGSSFPTRPRPTRLPCPRGLTRTEGTKRRKRGRKTAFKPAGSVAPQLTATTKRSRKRKADTAAAPPAPAQPNSVTGTPLRIPYGNKEVALKLGARYGSGDGMPRLELIFLHSASADGCNPAAASEAAASVCARISRSALTRPSRRITSQAPRASSPRAGRRARLRPNGRAARRGMPRGARCALPPPPR
jgi:DNA topoisomerase-3